MDHQIKFRAWDINFGRFLYTDWTRFRNWYTNENGGKIVCPRNSAYEKDYLSEPMRCLSLPDKKGKVMFELDIISHPRHNRPYSSKKTVKQVACLIRWSSGAASASPELNPSMHDNPSLFINEPKFIATPIDDTLKESKWGYSWSVFHDCIIIGNAFQNPEMIKKFTV